ncbi:serine arginine-rich splicing factor, variant 3 [Schistosoma haematobium]|uniref:Serine arginine-rich splicing factor, variant 3 n=1 Tax=Schistosoma haematobium TaxID=6185 RepID=A0A922ITH1_SCHHA|nr:serine arginine-rich splicing factor, variant 3 [Schistosoma haematobium]KAH9586914.1 serine arginine-rich splicing factor, variant 3 [Schistosoma haematobium]
MAARYRDVGTKVYIGDLPREASERELERIFREYGRLRNVWVARNPPGFAFVEFEDAADASDAVRELDGTVMCGVRARVELSTGKSRQKPWVRGGGGARNGGGRDNGIGVTSVENADIMPTIVVVGVVGRVVQMDAAGLKAEEGRDLCQTIGVSPEVAVVNVNEVRRFTMHFTSSPKTSKSHHTVFYPKYN